MTNARMVAAGVLKRTGVALVLGLAMPQHRGLRCYGAPRPPVRVASTARQPLWLEIVDILYPGLL